MFKNYIKNNKEIARAMFLYVSCSILGPLLVIGGIGYFVDQYFHTRWALFFSIFIAYIISNILMFRKLKKINKEIEKIKVENSPEKVNEIKNSYDEAEEEYNEKWPISPPNSNNNLDK